MTKHAIMRAKERFNLDLTSEDVTRIITAAMKRGVKLRIKHKDKTGTFNLKGNLGVYRLYYKHNWMDAVIKKQTHGKPPVLITLVKPDLSKHYFIPRGIKKSPK